MHDDVRELPIRSAMGDRSISVALANFQDEDMRQTELTPYPFRRQFGLPFGLSVGTLLALAACGGGGSDQGDATQARASRSTVSAEIEAAALPADVGSTLAQPTFHLAPVLLPEPSDIDAIDNIASAQAAPHAQGVTPAEAALGTRHMTVQALQASARTRALSAPRTTDGALAPAAAAGAATTYTPAQIRAAYALPTLPASSLAPTALQAAQQGAGQTIYIIDAMHNPNVAAELAAFNAKFGLPGCVDKTIATAAALPLPSASATDGCTLSVVYSTPAGAMSATVPAYDAGWATEIALDVQWAHATAPRARIVLIEAADASVNSLLGAVKLANAMGPGSVSMSFGGIEGNWTAQVDAAFAAAGMTYLAATGDSGSAVSWPAVSARVLAVGGTSLTYSGTAPRSETAWSKAGGGISAYTAAPAYQSNKVPGLGTISHRAVADVSFNADPYTGQYVAVMPRGSSSVSWVSAGGTSLSTPQWAGLVAVAKALRAQSAKVALGAPHTVLYTQIAQVPGTYAATFGDISSGANGTCAPCYARTGYDVPTGLGSPNATALLAALGGAAGTAPGAPVAPTVSAATVAGKVGSALSYSVSVSGATATTFTLSGAPSGMTITNGGVISWAAPAAGTYSVTVTAANAASGLSGKGVITVAIAAATPPVITAPAITGVAAKPLSGAITVSSPNGGSLSIQITGVPSGVTFSSSGQSLLLNWPRPVAGRYLLSITARDSAGLTASSMLSIVVNAR